MVCNDMRFARFTFGLVTVFCLIHFPDCQATVYYVSPTGSDSNSGISTVLPWKTISFANSQYYQGGDQLLFQGGATNSGTIVFSSFRVSGNSPNNPIVVSSYGGSPAVILNANGDTFAATNCGGLVISNINFVGGFSTQNITSCGIRFVASAANSTYEFVRIDHINVGGCGAYGVYIDSTVNSSRFSDVRITYVNAYSNNLAGIETAAPTWNVHSNIYVGYCNASSNPGLSSGTPGNGIELGSVINSLIEFCVASNNNTLGSGGVGIWCWYANNVTIQNCDSHHNHATTGGSDGDGFDIDIGCANCLIQHCYSHDNDGAAFPFYHGAYAGSSSPGFSNNVVRYNISQNDGRKNSYGAFSFWIDTSYPGPIGTGNVIYNNTIYVSKAPSGTTSAINYMDDFPNVSWYNNIFYTTNGVYLVTSSGTSTNTTFQGNDYFTSGEMFAIRFNGTNYGSLVKWREAGYETLNSTAVGSNVNPQLLDAGRGGTFNDATLLTNLTAYQTQSSSPMRDTGMNLPSLLSLNVGSSDYFEHTIPNGAGYDIGADDELTNLVVLPSLYLVPSVAGQATLSWSLGAIGMTLETTTDLAPGTWTGVTVITNGMIPIIIGTSNRTAYFRVLP